MTMRCPLCDSPDVAAYHRDFRRYLRCAACGLVFVPPEERLSRMDEGEIYLLHENAIDDPGYRQFLRRLADPLLARLAADSRGLDFGCGFAPVLADLLREKGHEVALHDSFFQPNPAALEDSYDFITATEVVEHLYRPGFELDRLWGCLRSGGWLAIMTKLVRDREAFATWHYIRDPTHVCFFSRDTWHWWAERHDAALEFVGDDVILLQKA